MTTGNKVDIKAIKQYEITIAKCGLLHLVWIADPISNCSKYKLFSGDEKIFETNYLWLAIEEYNKLV